MPLPWWRAGLYGVVHWAGGATAMLAVIAWNFGAYGPMWACLAATVGLAMVVCGMWAVDVAGARISVGHPEQLDESLRPPTL